MMSNSRAEAIRSPASTLWQGTAGARAIALSCGSDQSLHEFVEDPMALRPSPFHTCCRYCPGGSGRCLRRSLPDRWQPSTFQRRVGFRSARLEACQAFTRVVDRLLAESPEATPNSMEGNNRRDTASV